MDKITHSYHTHFIFVCRLSIEIPLKELVKNVEIKGTLN